MTDTIQLAPEHLDLLKERCLARFRYFCRVFMDPAWYDDGFHGPLCDALQNEEAPDTLVVMPRTHLKTTIAGQMYPVWLATREPSIRILLVYNSSDNAKKTLRSIRAFIESNNLYAALFPEIIPPSFTARGVRWSDECASVNRPEDWGEGTFEAAGTGTNIIRRHYDVIIQDDTVAPVKDQYTQEEVLPSKEEIEKAIGFHKLTIPLLLPPIEDSKRVVIGTRWAAMDLIQHIMDNEKVGVPGGRFICHDIPALDPETKLPNYKRFSMEALDSIRASMGPFMFNALYLNQPLSSEFMKFRPEWTRYFENSDETYQRALESGEVVITVDPADAPTGRRSQDYSAIVSCLQSEFGIHVLSYKRERVSEGQLINDTLDIAERDDARRIRVEVDRFANLEAGFRSEMHRRGHYHNIEAVKTRGKRKEARILRLAPLHEHGQLFFREGMRELENELYQFPRGQHDDIIDALAWQVLTDFRAPAFYRPAKKVTKHKRLTYTWDEIVNSVRGDRRTRYPFALQQGAVMGVERFN